MIVSLWYTETRELVKEWRTDNFSHDINLNVLSCWESLLEYGSHSGCPLESVEGKELRISHVEYNKEFIFLISHFWHFKSNLYFSANLLLLEDRKVLSDVPGAHNFVAALAPAILAMFSCQDLTAPLECRQNNIATLQDAAKAADWAMLRLLLCLTNKGSGEGWQIATSKTPQMALTSLKPVLVQCLESSISSTTTTDGITQIAAAVLAGECNWQLVATPAWTDLADVERAVLSIVTSPIITNLDSSPRNDVFVKLPSVHPCRMYRLLWFTISRSTRIVVIGGSDLLEESLAAKVDRYWEPLLPELPSLEAVWPHYIRMDDVPQALMAFSVNVHQQWCGNVASFCCRGYVGDSSKLRTITPEFDIILRHIFVEQNQHNRNQQELNGPKIMLTKISGALGHWIVNEKGRGIFVFQWGATPPQERWKADVLAAWNQITSWAKFMMPKNDIYNNNDNNSNVAGPISTT